MFFALVDNDRETFEEMLKWTENNLSAGDITKNFAAWLWGKDGSQWTILDTNNAVDSDMWIAYCLLEAGRLWDRPDYTEKARAMLELLKTQVRDIDNLGKVLLPGRIGFEHDGQVKLNPSYYPAFPFKTFRPGGSILAGCFRRFCACVDPQCASRAFPQIGQLSPVVENLSPWILWITRSVVTIPFAFIYGRA